MSTWDEEVRLAEHLADLADGISMRHFRQPSTTARAKADGTPVTEADETIENTLRSEIASAYPGHAVLGEEYGESGEDSTSRWILDPIDGTKNFSWGIPNWATLIALEVDGEVVCGVASAPALGERYVAARGSGARRNGEPIRVSEIAELERARLGFTSAAAFETRGFGGEFAALLRGMAHDRGLGDFYGHMLVASGSLDVMVEPELAPWDIAPLVVILEEAGGRVTDFAGHHPTAGGDRVRGGSCLTTNGLLHDAVLGVLGRLG